MGSRANLVILDGGRYELFYAHYGGLYLPGMVFWGPEHAEAEFRLHTPVPQDQWLDANWAEGGALLDKSRRKLLLFGGEDLSFDIPERRLYLQLLATVWKDWDVRWATRGVCNIAEYVGVSCAQLIKPALFEWTGRMVPCRDAQSPHAVASIGYEEGVRLYPLAECPSRMLVAGPELLKGCQKQRWLPSMRIPKAGKEFPAGGFHVDLREKTLDFWMARWLSDGGDLIRSRWPGWRVTWHQDQYEVHMDLTQGVLTLDPPPAEVVARQLTDDLLPDLPAADVQSPVDKRLIRDRDQRRQILAAAFGSIGMTPPALDRR